MLSTRRRNYQRSFALVFAIFLVVGLETVIAGNMFNMMRHHRQIERQVHRTQALWAAEAIGDRTLRLFAAYIRTEDRFPNVGWGLPNHPRIVLGNDSDVTERMTFSQYITKWYEGRADPTQPVVGGFINKAEYRDTLGPIHLAGFGIVITELPGDPAEHDVRRRYKISVDLLHGRTQVRTELVQEILIDKNNLFDFMVFCNEDCEIAAGPDFSVQGPIFSNGHLYLANDVGKTLTLKLADNFLASSNRQPYIIQSARNIYFWYKRAIGKNYHLDYPEVKNAIRDGGLPSYYADAPYKAELETFVDLGNEAQPHPPAFYYFFNSASDEGTWGKRPEDNKILVETVDGGCSTGTPGIGCQVLPHPGKRTLRSDGTFLVYGENNGSIGTSPIPSYFYGGYKQYIRSFQYIGRLDYVFSDAFSEGIEGNKMNLSAALARANPFDIDPVDPNNPPNSMSTTPPVNPNWLGGPGFTYGGHVLVRDGVSRRAIPIGSANHPSGPHVIIEPLTDTIPPANLCNSVPPENQDCYPQDTPEVKKAKFQYKAENKRGPKNGLNLYVLPSGGCSEDLQTLVDRGIVRGSCGSWPSTFDYRLWSTPGSELRIGYYRMIEIDMGELLKPQNYPNLELLYVHTYPAIEAVRGSKPVLVKLVNGSQLPDKGLTVATNGRLWIQGDYNTFDYSKGTNCTASEWDRHECQPPPAAIFSDSIGVLSKQWKDSFDNNTPLTSRLVTEDITVNTAIGTGFLESQLRRVYLDVICDQGYCGPSELGRWFGEIGYIGGFYCDDNSYVKGQKLVSQSCEFYQDPKTKVIYLNPKSTGRIQADIYPNHQFRQVARYQEVSKPPIQAGQNCQDEVACRYEVDSSGKIVLDGTGEPVRVPVMGDRDYLLPDCNPYPPDVGRFSGAVLFRAFQKVDLDRDGVLSGAEVQASISGIQASMGSQVGDPNYDARYDLNESGMVEVSDTSVLRILDGNRNGLPASECDDVKIPIVATPDSVRKFIEDWNVRGRAAKDPNWSLLEGMRPFVGTSYRVLNRRMLFGYVTGTEFRCWVHPPQSVSCPGVEKDGFPNDDRCPKAGQDATYNFCDATGDRGEPVCLRCSGGTVGTEKVDSYPKFYFSPYHYSLYDAQYSGGIENLMNLQEYWLAGRTFRLLGALSAPWLAQELKVSEPAFWQTSYYNPPVRLYDFNESLQTKPPPDTPPVFSIKRERWKEREVS